VLAAVIAVVLEGFGDVHSSRSCYRRLSVCSVLCEHERNALWCVQDIVRSL
jgi:hypothetical protein